MAAIAGLILSLSMKKSPVNSVDASSQYGDQRVPLEIFSSKTGGLTFADSKVTINGSLTVTRGVVIAPSVQPNAPVSGQLYFDTNTNQMAYYNGTGYVALTDQGAVVESVGGATGALTLGGGLSVVGNQLTVAFPQTTTGVTSFGGSTGAITVGSGLTIAGNTVSNSGVLTLTAGTPNLVVSNDGNGNLTISNVGGGSGTVTSGGGTAGRIAKFTGVQNVEDSLLSESGSTVTANGSLAVTGTLALATALTVGNGGIGTNILPSNGVLVGNGASAVSGVTAAGAGLCLVSTAGAPTFQACPGGSGVLTLNGLNGALTIANATGSVNTITIDDASTSGKGIASFNGTNFTVVSGVVNTAQNITTTSTPTFTGVNTNTITPSSTLTIGASGQTLNMIGGSGSTFVANGGGFTTTLGFSGAPTGSVAYNLDRSASAGTYTLCSTAGNCVGLGGTVSSTGGTTNRLSKFSTAQAIVDSSVSDDGSTVTVNGTANLVVQGGTGTFGTLTQGGTLALSDGSSNTISFVSAPLSANRIITLPDVGGDATLCLNSGNCIGGTGSAPNTAAYLVAALDGTLTNERALSGGTNISLTDGGANGSMTVATVNNPTFTTSVTTPILQSSGALTISSAAGNIIAVDAGTTIELQDSTNVTGSLDVSVALNVGTANAFQVTSGGAIAAATGITSSGTIVFSGLNCTGNANGGVLTTNGSGQLICDDDDGGAGGAISGSGTSGTIPLFNGTQTITNSIITQAATTITIAGDLSLNTQLSVANGGTGATSLTTRGLLYGNGTGAVQVTAAGTSGQVMIADGSGVPTFATFSGDLAVSSTGVTTIQANSVALGTDTTGNYVANLGTLTGLSTSGNTGEGSTPTLSVNYGSIANTAVQGNVSLTCPSGAGNLTGGGTAITLGAGGTCADISIVNNPTFTTSVTTPAVVLTGAGSDGTIQVGTLGQGTVYTLPDPGSASTTICIATGNCATAGAAGGDLTGSYPNPTIAKLQGTNLNITSPVAGHILVYNGTSGEWQNQAISGDIAIDESGTATIQANSVALGTDTTGNYVLSLTAGNGISVTGSAGEGWTPTVSALYGATANTAVEGNTSITVTAGTNLTGGGSITLGAGGSVSLNVSNSPTFSGTLTVQGATATIGTAVVAGSVVLSDGSSNTGTIQTAALGQDTVYTLPDPGAGSASICLTTGNCAGTGGGVTTAGGSTNQLAKFTGSQTLGNSSISDDGSTVTINGTANMVVQGGTATLGTLTQAGTLAVSDGSSNTVSIVASGLAADHIYTLPDAGSDATFCLSTGNCIGGGSGGAPNDATYLVASLNGTLTNERALAGGTNISLTDGGAGGSMTVATVNNPTFTTSVTTPILQSSGALVISSAAGNTVAVDAGTTIELQDSTNVTGSLDVSVALNVGTANAFQVSSGGAVTAATGVTSSGTITFSGLDCTSFANGGVVTANGSGVLSCADDDGAAGGTITGAGTTGTIPVFDGTNSIADSIITQAATTITIAGDLSLSTQLSVANGGTGATSFTTRGLLYGNGTGAVQVTAAGTSGQVMVASATGTPTFVSFSGDVAVSDTGVTTIQANSVALGTDTTGNYVANLGTLTGLSATGNTGEGSTPTLSVQYGSGANTSVQGNVSLTCPSGTGNLSGGGNSITLGAGGSCTNISTVNNPTFTTSVTTPLLALTGAGSTGSLQVATLGQTTTYTLPDPGGSTATICLSTGNCTATGTAGGDLTGSYPNPTIAKLQSGTLTITSVASGNILQYNGSAWVNQSVSGDIVLSSAGVATIQNNAVTSAKINDGTIVNGDLAAGSFTNITAVGTLTSLTVTGAANINTSGTANTAIGNATGSFQVTSSGLNVSTGGALTGVSGITTSGGYTQSGTTANTFTGATSFTAAGTALSVTNNASIGGTLAVNTITPTGAFTAGATGQSFTLQGNGMSTVTATDSGNTTTLGFVTPTANTTINVPALTAGTYTLCTSSGNCGGVGATLQTAYNFSTNPELVLDATRGALTIRDNSTPLGANLLEVQSNSGATTYFNVTAAGTNTTGTITSSGNINTTAGVLQTNSTTRVDNSGNLTNINNITAAGGTYLLQGTASASTSLATIRAGATPGAGAHLLSLQDSGSLEHAYFNNIGNQLTLGRVAASGTVSQGQLLFADGTTDNFSLTLQSATLTASRTITLPDATGTVCLTTGNCGGVTTVGGTTNRLAKFTGGQAIGDSSITDTGSAVTLASNVDLSLTGATAYISNPQGQTNSESFGLNAAAAGADSLVVGSGATGHASGGSTAVGSSSNAGANAVALGYSTDAQGNAVAIGYNSFADSAGIAIGRDTSATTNSIALGRDASTTASNQLVIGSSTAGEYINQVIIGSGVTSATPTAFTLQGTGGSGTNVAGAAVSLAGGQSTGNAAGGGLNFRISAPGTSGSGVNALTTVGSFSGTNGSFLLKSAVNSTAAFQVQNAGSTPLLTLDTTNNAFNVASVLTSLTGATTGDALNVSNSTSTGNIAVFKDNSTAVVTIADGGGALFKPSADTGTAFQIQNAASTSLLSVSTLAGTNSAVQLYAPNAIATTTTEGLWLRAPKNAVTVLLGDNDSTAAYTANQSSANVRFNGSGVGWGDFGYYPQGGGNGNNGQFRFSTTGGSIATTPNAKVGVGDLYVNGVLGISTNAPSYNLGFGAGANRTIGVETQTASNTAGNNLTISSATGNGTGAGGVLTVQGGNGGSGGAGGNVLVAAGNAAGAGNKNGGNVTLQGGSYTGTGAAGAVIVKNATDGEGFIVQNAAGTQKFISVDTSDLIVNIGSNGTSATTATVAIGTSTAQDQYVYLGSTASTSETGIYAGTGNITLQSHSSVIVQSLTDGADAFAVQDSIGNSILSVNTQTNLTTAFDLQVNGTFAGAGLTDCDATNSKVLWDATTKQFSCGTDRASVSVRKTTDTSSTNNTTNVDDGELTFAVGANDTYIFHMNVNHTSSGGNIRYKITGPTGVTCNIDSLGLDTAGFGVEMVNTACNSAYVAFGGGGTTATNTIDGTVKTNGTAGSITFRFQQDVSSGTATVVKAGSSLLAYKVNGADLAEAYYTRDNTIAPGDVVSLDPHASAGVNKAAKPYDSNVMGIVSTNPGQVLADPNAGSATGRPVLVALSGRIPVRVSLENGPIEPGDYLTSSSTPGVAMKATQPGQMIGKALEGFSSTTPDAKGIVMTFANLTWANPNTGAASNQAQGGTTQEQMQGTSSGSFANLNVTGDAKIGGTLTVTGQVTVGSLLVNGHIVTAGTAPKMAVQAAAGNGASVTVTGNDTAGRITVVTGDAPTADDLTKLTFHTAYGRGPEVVLTPIGKGSASVQPYVDAVDANSFMLGANQVPLPHTTYVFTYHVIGTTE